MSLVKTNYSHLAALDDALTGNFQNVVIGLIVNDYTFSRDSDIADLEEPVYSNYDRVAVVWSDPYRDVGQQGYSVSSQLINFSPESTLDPAVVVYGFFIASTGSIPVLLAGENFLEPQLLANTLTSVLIAAQVSFGASNEGEVSLVQ